MKESVRLPLVLTLVAVISAILVATANEITKKPISEAKARSFSAALSSVLPPDAGEPVAVEYVFNGETCTGYVAGASVAVTAESGNGYGGAISFLAGFDGDGKLYDYSVLEAHETPGLGAKIDPKIDKTFRDGVKGKGGAGFVWKVRKDGGEIDAITAATITSRAACGAFDEASKRREAIIAGAVKPSAPVEK